MFAGGCEELDWTLSVLFDAMGAMSSKYNDTPPRPRAPMTWTATASSLPAAPACWCWKSSNTPRRAARKHLCRDRRLWRDLRRLRHGRALGRRRGALHEDGARDGEGADRLHQSACHCDADRRPQGDRGDPRGVRPAKCPPISATKSLTGHSLGAAGVQEAIYSLLMMNNGFICESANIENLDPAFADMPIVRERRDNVTLSLRAVELVRLRRHQCIDRASSGWMRNLRCAAQRASHRDRPIRSTGRRTE